MVAISVFRMYLDASEWRETSRMKTSQASSVCLISRSQSSPPRMRLSTQRSARPRGIAFGKIACKEGREGFLGRPRFGMEAGAMEGFSGIFSQVEDPRTGNARRHDLCELLVIALCSCLCGGTTCTEMAEFAEDKEPFLREFLTLKNGLPSHDTFSRLFRLLDPAAFGACFSEFMRAFSRQTAGVVAVDAFKPGQPWMSCSQSTSSQTT